jgi:16S rRNA (cytosine1402-N4)-methyltransferase
MMTRRSSRGGPSAASGAETARPRHIPVLLRPLLHYLRPRSGATYIDATFGAGGYTRAMLERAPGCRVIAIDRDPAAIAGGADLAKAYPDRLVLVAGRFGDMEGLAAEAGAGRVQGVVFDLGVSSMQLDEPERGFSFQSDGPLDMRMSKVGPTAAELLATLEEAELADIFYRLGEERRSRAIARAIVSRRRTEPIVRTRQLAELVTGVLGGRRAGDGKHPATRTFQALRLAVNDELGELERGLAAAERLLEEGGRLIVVTFHSLEDRIVKRFLGERSGRAGRASRHLPDAPPPAAPTFRILNQKPVSPDTEEIAANPRSRSAKLRAAERTSAPPWPAGGEHP